MPKKKGGERREKPKPEEQEGMPRIKIDPIIIITNVLMPFGSRVGGFMPS
jgi:hypothetical protein